MWKPTPPPLRENKNKVFKELGDTGQFIYQMGESDLLRKLSRPVSLKEVNSVIFREKLGYLRSCLLKYRELTGMGKGIAAVQVGIPEQFFLLFMPEVPKGILSVINPKITKVSDKLYRHSEMCMSAAPILVNLIRPAWIEFDYYDEEGKEKQWRIKDKTYEEKSYNRVVQHEIDHLSGTINIDRVEAKTLVYYLDPSFYKKTPYEEV